MIRIGLNATRRLLALGASTAALLSSCQAAAQETSAGAAAGADASSGAIQSADAGRDASPIPDIVVTAQRQSQSLQSVPIAVTAFTAEALQQQQIDTTNDLQLYVPNLSFTRGNFTDANISLRGVSDAGSGGLGRDAAVGIHFNDMPLLITRIVETELFDLERVEVLRGPQGTLFGRNASAGVINFISARPASKFAAAGEAEYGNYDSVRLQGMVNLPLTDWAALRVAGLYFNRDGTTRNDFDGSRVDGRDKWAVRGTLRLTRGDDTTVDIIGSYFKEDDTRLRSQKQLCRRDPTGVLGCQPGGLAFEAVNGNASLAQLLTSNEFLGIASGGALAPFGLGSVYAPDAFAEASNPADFRRVNADFRPSYRADELIVMGRWEQRLSDLATLTVKGGYQEESSFSRTDYNLLVGRSLVGNAGIGAFRAVFPQSAAALFRGPDICVSEADRSYVGYIGGKVNSCAPFSTDYDQASSESHQASIEAHVDTRLDGPLNFLLGGIYVDSKASVDYFVASSGLDYASAVLAGGQGGLAPPFYNNEATLIGVKSAAVFGEAYLEPSDGLKVTLGLRYTRDEKRSVGRQPLINFPVPFGTQDLNALLGTLDVDAGKVGVQPFFDNSATFKRLTGRFVVDWKPVVPFTDDTLIYASYSRGYRAGGVNSGFNPNIVDLPLTFRPETVNAFEIGTKNRFGGGLFQMNLAGFYYDYKDTQTSRSLFRTTFTDSFDAETYGVEGEFLINPTRSLQLNVSASALKTRIKSLSLPDSRDPSGGRSDVVIIKDVTSAANCAVIPAAAGVPRGDALVGAVNASVGLRPPVPVPGTSSTGAFSICSALASTIAATGAPYLIELAGGATRSAAGGGFAPITDPATLALASLPVGASVDLTGNELPYAPRYKISGGAQHTLDVGRGMTLVLRGDYARTGRQFARNYNQPVDRIPRYDVINAQAQLNGPDGRWYVRGFVQNIENDDNITGQYVADPAPGLFTNVFTLDPRRYGVATGFKF